MIPQLLLKQELKQWAVGREFNGFIKKKFDEKGIEIPFPQRTVHIMNEGK